MLMQCNVGNGVGVGVSLVGEVKVDSVVGRWCKVEIESSRMAGRKIRRTTPTNCANQTVITT